MAIRRMELHQSRQHKDVLQLIVMMLMLVSTQPILLLRDIQQLVICHFVHAIIIKAED